MKDYYKILEVNRNCTIEELNKSYRELVFKYHPDKNVDNIEECSKKFKEIQEAYEFLIKNSGAKNFEFKKNSIDDIFDNIFSKFFGNQKKDGSSKIRVKISFEESYMGCSKIVEIDKHEFCNNCQGTGGSSWENCDKCSGKGFVESSSCVHCMGVGSNIKIRCFDCSGKGFLVTGKNKINIEIPPGIEDGTQMRIANQASDGGDLYVTINIQKSEEFRRENLDIISSLDVPYSKMVLGGNIDFKLFKNIINLKIKPRTKSGSKLLIKNQGFVSLCNSKKGNLILNINVKMPDIISKEYKDQIEKLSNFENL